MTSIPTTPPLRSSDVSAVVCTWNAVGSIEQCLRALHDNDVREIILVDADSDDGTVEVAAPFVDAVVQDPRRGLGLARQLGVARTSGKLVLNCGADNVMPPGSVQAMINFLSAGGFTGVSAVTTVNAVNYWGWAMDRYKRARFFPGERSVIGTPTLLDGALLRQHPYNTDSTYSDDAELCERWASQFNARFAISDVVVREVGQESWRSVKGRWKIYGRSDFEIYTAHQSTWSAVRRIKSILYPLREELIKPFLRIPGMQRLATLPFLLIITTLRYKNWIEEVMKAPRNMHVKP